MKFSFKSNNLHSILLSYIQFAREIDFVIGFLF